MTPDPDSRLRPDVTPADALRQTIALAVLDSLGGGNASAVDSIITAIGIPLDVLAALARSDMVAVRKTATPAVVAAGIGWRQADSADWATSAGAEADMFERAYYLMVREAAAPSAARKEDGRG